LAIGGLDLLIRFLRSFVRLSDARCADYGEQVTSIEAPAPATRSTVN